VAREAGLAVPSRSDLERSIFATSRIENYLASFVEAKKIKLFPAICVPPVGILMIWSIDSRILIGWKMRVGSNVVS
jgi:hypothetical protein